MSPLASTLWVALGFVVGWIGSRAAFIAYLGVGAVILAVSVFRLAVEWWRLHRLLDEVKDARQLLDDLKGGR